MLLLSLTPAKRSTIQPNWIARKARLDGCLCKQASRFDCWPLSVWRFFAPLGPGVSRQEASYGVISNTEPKVVLLSPVVVP